MIMDMMSEIEKLDTTELRRGSLTENVKRVQKMYKDLEEQSRYRQRTRNEVDTGSSASGSNSHESG